MSIPIVGPIAPYTNPPINPDDYQPRVFEIAAITLGKSTTITTTEDHDYVVGQLCRLIIPYDFGSRQLNEQQGYVTTIPSSTQVTLNINSVGVDAFTTSSGGTQAQIMAIGDINTGQTNASGAANQTTYIPGSFINISPN